ncbi:MAG: hypothetical protein QXE70_10860 [Ignisphaera sp.]
MRLFAYIMLIFVVAVVILFVVWFIGLSITLADWFVNASGVAGAWDIYRGFIADRDKMLNLIEIGLIVCFLAMFIAVFAYSRRR